ncbi:hypothetical protein BCV69DRAFT_281075 [Microstroma glucosiphilum]|uniref:Uncharacterized protein n=1 Tax=Pseudomicrostroma glucosiphilum TaxID=1684307 RepID=A0A316UJQ8_9BASI|nr:hypothetical protein BCV69DRAFT_281075 [Pseudomicrostroma glucosiphilum]PWN23455.1 hypothetical protein BCV69DRAFT_281075 [Pseudomicrostroma glucosiphilum]
MRTGPCKSTEPDGGAAEQRAWPPGQRAYKQRWKTLDQASQSVYQEDDHEDSDAEGTDSGADDCQSDGQQSEHDSAASDGESVQCEEAEGSASYQADHVEFVASAPYDDGSSLNQDYGSDFEQDYGSDYDQDYSSDYSSDY